MIALIKKFINNGLTEALDVKLDRIEVDTTAIETKVDAVDTVVDTINTNVGSNADSASATGSVHAKLKDIKNYVDFQNHNLITYEVALINPGSAKQTLVNYTGGRGCLKSLSIPPSATTLDITIDGTLVTSLSGAQATILQATTLAQLVPDCNFDNSLKIEFQWVQSGSGSLTIRMACEYLTP